VLLLGFYETSMMEVQWSMASQSLFILHCNSRASAWYLLCLVSPSLPHPRLRLVLCLFVRGMAAGLGRRRVGGAQA
jgi:hypothetical protein